MGLLVACILGGWFGLHKFIEKKTGLGILYLCTFGLFGIGWIVDCIIYIVRLLNKPNVINTAPPVEQPKKETVTEPLPVEEYNRLNKMCLDIHKEYKELLKDYNDATVKRKTYILRECYRKLTVMESTINKHNCYQDIDIYDEYEKIEKKARSFINSYIKEQRDNGCDDYLIDVMQFSDDLDFIADYIYEKDEKLNE